MARCLYAALMALLPLALLAQEPAREPPREWIDPDTGHRVIRLSEEPGSQSLYFHQNGYTPDVVTLVITTPSCRHGPRRELDYYGHEYYHGQIIYHRHEAPSSRLTTVERSPAIRQRSSSRVVPTRWLEGWPRGRPARR